MSAEVRREIAQLWVAELEAVDHRLLGGQFVCGCDPATAVFVDETGWCYDRSLGWHDPQIPHDAYWPTGGAA